MGKTQDLINTKEYEESKTTGIVGDNKIENAQSYLMKFEYQQNKINSYRTVLIHIKKHYNIYKSLFFLDIDSM